MCVCVCVCVYAYREMVDFGESDRTRQINRTMDNPIIDNGFNNDISSFIQKIWLNPMSVIGLYIASIIFLIYIYIYIYIYARLCVCVCVCVCAFIYIHKFIWTKNPEYDGYRGTHIEI